MRGITNATKGSSDVVQDTEKVKVLGTTLQEATDTQPGVMSAADHTALSTTATRVGTCFDDVNISGSHLVFDKINGNQKEIELPTGTSYTAGYGIGISNNAISVNTGTIATVSKVNPAFNSVSVSDKTLKFSKISGASQSITLDYPTVTNIDVSNGNASTIYNAINSIVTSGAKYCSINLYGFESSTILSTHVSKITKSNNVFTLEALGSYYVSDKTSPVANLVISSTNISFTRYDSDLGWIGESISKIDMIGIIIA